LKRVVGKPTGCFVLVVNFDRSHFFLFAVPSVSYQHPNTQKSCCTCSLLPVPVTHHLEHTTVQTTLTQHLYNQNPDSDPATVGAKNKRLLWLLHLHIGSARHPSLIDSRRCTRVSPRGRAGGTPGAPRGQAKTLGEPDTLCRPFTIGNNHLPLPTPT